ncbi:MAG: hypothetical protein MJ119_00475 [Lachnospiraceae bacterium]|nr:hypothetical protein [Lachnospiraceae bacterium]
MKFPIFASILVFCIWLAYEIRKANKNSDKSLRAFREREAKADATRKQSLDSLQYIVISDEILNLLNENFPEELKETASHLERLKDAKTVNLSNITNTDLKLMYGAANLPLLTEYDQNYLLLTRSLIEMGEYYNEHKDFVKAKLVLEFAVSTGCDSVGVYKILTDIYNSENDTAKLNYLKSSASMLNGITKGPIMDYLYSVAPQDKSLEESIFDILD